GVAPCGAAASSGIDLFHGLLQRCNELVGSVATSKIVSGSAAMVLSLGLVCGPQSAMLAERFDTRFRYSATSLSYQLAAPLAGGLTSIIAVILLTGKSSLAALGLTNVVIDVGAGSWQAVAGCAVALAAVSLASTCGLKELSRADISCEVVSPAAALAVGGR
ncbi:MHS family MFS transporter, partial [Nocardia terpenica]